MKKIDRQCRRKVRHKKKIHAVIALKKMEKKNFFIHERRIYYCENCGGWHIGRVNKLDPTVFKRLKKLTTKV